MDNPEKRKYNKTKHDFSAGTEITRLSIEMLKLAGQVRALAAGEKPVVNLEAKASNLREEIQSLKLKNSRGDGQLEDNYRMMALQMELGKTLLQIDGIL